MKKLAWWMTFLFATYSLSKLFEASRLITSESPQGSLMGFLMWAGVLFLLVLLLGYDAYSKSRLEGKVVHRVWFFETLYQLQHQERTE